MKRIIPTNSSTSTLRTGTRKTGTGRNGTSHTETDQAIRKPANRPLAISLQRIQKELDTDGTDLGISPAFRKIRPQFDVHVFDELPSTSTQLWDMLGAGAKSGTVAIAQQQSAGRGQRGRVWQSEPGGLYLSLALEPDWPVALSAQLTCFSAWGIATAFNNLGIPVQIKWPNDLFFRGKKLGGILTETKLAQQEPPAADHKNSAKAPVRIKQAVIGVGINWHNPVPQSGISLAKILEENTYVTLQNKINCLEVLIALVLKGILQGYYFHQQVGSQVFMKAYQNLLTQVGNLVSIRGDSISVADASVGSNTVDRTVIQPYKQSHEQPRTQVANNSNINRSGKVIGISEEGYLQVALHSQSDAAQAETHQDKAVQGEASRREASASEASRHGTQAAPLDNFTKNILLIRPSEIHTS
ncbi:MAG: biotin--[acetyl-CoA-carboxylase] ligase [Cyanobacteria bacterium J06649_4]